MRSAPPAQSERLTTLLARACENGLEPIDTQTITDICELSGRYEEEVVALLAAIFLCLREGSVCVEVSRSALARRFDGLLDTADAAALAGAIVERVEADGFPEFAGRSAMEAKPVILQSSGGRTLAYFQKFLKHERVLRELFLARLKNAGAVHPRAGEILSEVLSGPGRPQRDFSAEQKLAIALALLRNFVVVSGGPGTGKTSAVFAMLRAIVRTGVSASRIALACPTGRAAQRLTESIRAGVRKLERGAGSDGELSSVKAGTLHRLLGYSPSSGSFAHHCENPLPCDVIVVDELSMVDIVMMSRLMDAVPPHAKLILLGDKNQLPSVDAGSVLSDLMPRDGQPLFSLETAALLQKFTGVTGIQTSKVAEPLRDAVVVLQTNFRSQQHICEVANAINALPIDSASGAAEALVAELPRVALKRSGESLEWPEPAWFAEPMKFAGGCWLLDTPDAWHDIVLAWATHHYVKSGYLALADETAAPGANVVNETSLRKLFELLQGARILTLVREGPFGSVQVNRKLARALRPGRSSRTNALFPGAPVLITSNDYTLDVFNGDVGVALAPEETGAGMRVVFERQDERGDPRFLSIPEEALPAHELAFAMTVHKSQGSEYGQILLALPSGGAQRLMNRQMVYTAITRARDLAVICGTPDLLSAAVCRTLERTSGLDLARD